MRVQVKPILLNRQMASLREDTHKDYHDVVNGFNPIMNVFAINRLLKQGLYETAASYEYDTDKIDKNFARNIFCIYQNSGQHVEFDHRSISIGDIIGIYNGDDTHYFVVTQDDFLYIEGTIEELESILTK